MFRAVPVAIEVVPNSGTLREQISNNVDLKCKVTAFPKSNVVWKKLQNLGNGDGNITFVKVEEDGRIRTQYREISESVQESTLIVESAKTSDNGTYLCFAKNEFNESKALVNLVILEPPQLRFDRIETVSARTAVLYWTIENEGNTPLKKLLLQIRNYSLPESDWLEVDGNVKPNKTGSYIVRYLAPAVTYGFQLAAINDVGQSQWAVMNATMPADVPARISVIHVLAKTNETLLIGWKRPNFDNGSPITQYQMELRDAKDNLVFNQTKDVESASGAPKTRHMYMFVSLEPGSPYFFQIRACSSIGCGNWSEPKLQALTSDGHADPPQNVRLRCYCENESSINYVIVAWELPINARGTIIGYNVTLEGSSRFRNEENIFVEEHFKEAYELKGNLTVQFKGIVKPNTNYTVRVCTLNKAGCGSFSHITSDTMCTSYPTVPTTFPVKLRLTQKDIPDDESCCKLKLIFPRISERNGAIKCYQILIIKLPKNLSYDHLLTFAPNELSITNYTAIHANVDGEYNSRVGVYVAEEFDSEKLVNDIIIGDNFSSKCEADDEQRNTRKRRSNSVSIENNSSISPFMERAEIYDGPLSSSTNYSGFVQVTVVGQNGTILTKQSQYFEPVLTGTSRSPNNALSPLSPIFASMSDSASAVLFGIICGLILVFLLLLFVLCFLKRKASDSSHIADDERLGLTTLIRRTVAGHKNGHIPNSSGISAINSTYKWIGQPVPIQNLPSIFQERHINSDLLFQAEFEALPEDFGDRTTNSSDSPENISKNRYPDIKSFDQTRVKLSLIDGVPGSDYINADFVEGYKSRKLYICAQGPLDRTTADFWRMIYEHKVSVIVMLTGIEEHGKIKCAQYWPDEGVKQIDKLYKIVPQSVRKFNDFIARRFFLQTMNEDETPRDILQFHFLMWKDFLAPEQPSWLLRFIKRVNEHYCPDKGPLLVHCSAGVGRTGTFIAIDSMIPEITSGTHLNVFECVSQLRYQRNFLVQSLKQYIFVYRALMEFAQFGDTEIEICHLKDHYRQLKEQKFEGNINGVMAEFDRLNEVIEDTKSVCVGTMDMNMNKNRYDFIIPYDINRVILPPSPSKDHSSYINASFVQGYDRYSSFIVTQDPLDNSFFEFWKMVAEQNVCTLVMLSELGEGQSKCQCYWPKDESSYDYVHVKFEKEENLKIYVKRYFTVKNKRFNGSRILQTNVSQELVQFQMLEWKSGVVPESTLLLTNLIEVTLSNNSTSGSPIVIHCSGGGDRSSLFVTLASLIQQIRVEERVDVFQTARYTRSQRPCMLHTIAQYDFLYRSLIDFIESHNLCDNMSDTQL
ncbi:tyrosine-protein phosphatase 69D-like protein [Leptotrombidium deliense]|uniref:protein-tyrosine-phosphatase n=1 Tax=Leptotrombidium deliense TaxID=299467 RepID=A0A443SWZ6_9ACAR|nr:tyrosine-protein phosphatase 69D-like protein [Leptotrombidium deliense]